MITSRSPFRSRRRQSSLALFGRPRHRTKVEPAPEESRAPLHGIADRAPRDEPLDVGNGIGPQVADLQEVIARVQREARANQRLRELASAAELDRMIDDIVCSLWASSRVKTFVPLLAMRRVYESLGIAEETIQVTDDQ